MSIRAAIAACMIPVALGCCAGAGQTARTAPRHDPNLITAEELATANASNLYDAIRQLRPAWMEPLAPTALRPLGAPSGLLVYVDRVREGGVEALRSLPLTMVESVRFLSASEAQGEFGLDNIPGAIRVVTRRSR